MRLPTVNFITKSWSKSFNNGIVYNRVGFKCVCATVSRQDNSALLQFSYQSNWIWKVNGKLQFQKFPTHQCTKMLRREKICFLTRKFQFRQTSILWNLVLTLPLRISLKPWTLCFKKNTTTAKIVSHLKCLEGQRNLRFTLQMKDLVLRSLVQIWDTFLEVMLVLNLE